MWFDDVPRDQWQQTILAAPDPPALANVLFDAWVHHRLEQTVDEDRALGRAFVALAEAGIRPDPVIHDADSTRHARIWCWAPSLHLSSQDEDLMLMAEGTLRPLLEEANRGCPKRAYAYDIVTHALRDKLHHALWPRDGWTEDGDVLPVAAGDEVVLGRIDRILSLAEAVLPLVEDDDARDYCLRLASYRRDRDVDEREVHQRVLDCRRCRPRPEEPVSVRRDGDRFVATLARASITDGHLVVDARTGRMWAVLA